MASQIMYSRCCLMFVPSKWSPLQCSRCQNSLHSHEVARVEQEKRAMRDNELLKERDRMKQELLHVDTREIKKKLLTMATTNPERLILENKILKFNRPETSPNDPQETTSTAEDENHYVQHSMEVDVDETRDDEMVQEKVSEGSGGIGRSDVGGNGGLVLEKDGIVSQGGLVVGAFGGEKGAGSDEMHQDGLPRREEIVQQVSIEELQEDERIKKRDGMVKDVAQSTVVEKDKIADGGDEMLVNGEDGDQMEEIKESLSYGQLEESIESKENREHTDKGEFSESDDTDLNTQKSLESLEEPYENDNEKLEMTYGRDLDIQESLEQIDALLKPLETSGDFSDLDMDVQRSLEMLADIFLGPSDTVEDDASMIYQESVTVSLPERISATKPPRPEKPKQPKPPGLKLVDPHMKPSGKSWVRKPRKGEEGVEFVLLKEKVPKLTKTLSKKNSSLFTKSISRMEDVEDNDNPPLSPSRDEVGNNSKVMKFRADRIKGKLLKNLKKKKEEELTDEQRQSILEKEENRRKKQETQLKESEALLLTRSQQHTVISTKSTIDPSLKAVAIEEETTRPIYQQDSDQIEINIKKAIPEEGSDFNKKREYIVKEILSTEKTYTENLKQAIEAYYIPMIDEAKTDKTINIEIVDTMFLNMKAILPLNQDLYLALKERVDNWSENAQIGDVFVKFGPFLKMYTQYSNSYDSAKKALETAALEPWFVRFCRAKVLIESLLINPIQRIPRYALLLEDLWKHTSTSHVDEKNLTKAMLSVKKVADHINIMLAKEKNFDKLTSEGLIGLLAAHRTLVMDEMFPVVQITNLRTKKTEKLKTKEYKFYLFNDSLVYLDSNTAKKKEKTDKDYELWPTEIIWLKRLPNNIILLMGPGKHITINTQSTEQQERWWSGLNEVIQTQLEKTQASFLPKDFSWVGCAETLDKRKGTMKWGDGSTYQGWWFRGNMQGAGVFEYLGGIYSGNFEKNIRDGPEGKMRFTNGSVYQGDWKNGKPHGQGTLKDLNGNVFTGKWEEGYRYGSGTLNYFNGDTYNGSFKKDNLVNEGSLVLANKTTYVGSFQKGLFNGEGTLTTRAGTFFGDFVDGVKQGRGVLKQNIHEPVVYEGTWKSGYLHGFGKLEDSLGKYEGDWEKGLKKGKGKMTYKDGSTYDGYWLEDKRHGMGDYECPKGYVVGYHGEWSRDKKNGKGKMRLSNGNTYDGGMVDDLPQGHGVYTCKSPKGNTLMVVEGKWVRGVNEGKCNVTLFLKEGGSSTSFTYDPEDSDYADFALPAFFPPVSWQDGE
eukprot:TRINITY_DN7181_c0_g1_i1.p1 TRINITY_DN7181_c0_g1~~TRINITY_DN7181_c0_g1_i1.p1  ORF type:complete len:1288 (+),score=388.27 TRINITY_DN7181_c0_g1_i1:29-3865(+)